ncbi:MAG: membrane complex biogenesis BtpA family protein [Planctomycetota bacterium]|jgi:membrane complex biogenesis BtpA family protein
MNKKLIAVLHLPPLPGSPRCEMSRDEIWQRAHQEAETYVHAGIQTLIIENHGDAPFFPDENPAHVSSFVAVLADRIKRAFGCQIGINLLRNDARGSLAAAAASGAEFVRVNVLSGVAATDQGLVSGKAHELMRERRAIEAPTEIWADINVKFATQLYQPNLADLAKATAQRSLADAIIVTGPATGRAADPEDLRAAKNAVGSCPVYVGSGVTAESVGSFLSVCDGVIVGSDLKKDGYVENPIDPTRLATFVAAFEKAQST